MVYTNSSLIALLASFGCPLPNLSDLLIGFQMKGVACLWRFVALQNPARGRPAFR